LQVRIRHTPAFGVARLLLAPGEAVQGDFGALLAASFGVLVDVRGRNRRGPKAALFTAPAEGGWIDLAPGLPGEVHALELDGVTGWCVTRGSLLASASTIRADPNWPGFRQLFGADSGFLEHTTGQGPLVLACCGALDVVNLAAGEAITVDPGSLIAYTDGIQCRLRAASQSIHQSIRTGEGLLLDFAGPGQLLTQTRKPVMFAASIAESRS
jgi:uncharacterized protein (AIM24 family)